MGRQARSYVVRTIWCRGAPLLDGTTIGNMELELGAAYAIDFWERAAPSTCFGVGEGGKGGEGKFHAYGLPR